LRKFERQRVSKACNRKYNTYNTKYIPQLRNDLKNRIKAEFK